MHAVFWAGFGYNGNIPICVIDSAMLKKIVLVLVILAPSALYLYIVNREPTQPKPSTQPAATQTTTTEKQYQTPDH